MQLDIHPVSEEELDQVLAIETVLQGEHAATREVLEIRRNMFADGFLVACVDGKVVGYLESCIWNSKNFTTFNEIRDFPSLHNITADNLYIIFLAVAEESRRMGIATALLKKIINVAQSLAKEEVQLVSTHDYQPLYQKVGFQNTRFLPNFLDAVSGYEMVKYL